VKHPTLRETHKSGRTFSNKNIVGELEWNRGKLGGGWLSTPQYKNQVHQTSMGIEKKFKSCGELEGDGRTGSSVPRLAGAKQGSWKSPTAVTGQEQDSRSPRRGKKAGIGNPRKDWG